MGVNLQSLATFQINVKLVGEASGWDMFTTAWEIYPPYIVAPIYLEHCCRTESVAVCEIS